MVTFIWLALIWLGFVFLGGVIDFIILTRRERKPLPSGMGSSERFL